MDFSDVHYPRTNNPVKFIGVGWIPALLGCCITTGAIISFVWAVLAEDVTVFVPFISEAGADSPQSGFFSLMIFLSCIWSTVTMTIRYSIVRQLLRFNRGNTLNNVSLIVGYLAIFGLSLVAAYPLTSDTGVHNFGASSMFLLGALYCLLQTVLSHWMYPWHNGRLIVMFRGVITCIACVAVVITGICQAEAKTQWAESGINKEDDMRVPGDPAFVWYTTASICEWITMAMFVTYFFSFIREFNKVVLELDVYPLVDHFDDDVGLRFTTSENTPLFKSVL